MLAISDVVHPLPAQPVWRATDSPPLRKEVPDHSMQPDIPSTAKYLQAAAVPVRSESRWLVSSTVLRETSSAMSYAPPPTL